jgi:hypothetical protein
MNEYEPDLDAILDLIAELEREFRDRPNVYPTLESLERHTVMPIMLQALPEPIPNYPPPASPVMTTVEAPHTAPLTENPFVRNILMMLPYEVQAPIGNVLATAGLTWKRALVLCLALAIVGVATGYITIPESALRRIKEMYTSMACPRPVVLAPIPPVETPKQ